MKYLPASKKYAKDISGLMLTDLNKADPKFPEKMLSVFKEHAKEENIIKEFDNSSLIAYVAIDAQCVGFIVGYDEGETTAMIHYISSGSYEMKHELLKEFLAECKRRKITKVKTDTFEFMENNEFFKKEGFVLVNTEKLGEDLEMLWYEIELG